LKFEFLERAAQSGLGNTEYFCGFDNGSAHSNCFDNKKMTES